MEEAFLRWRASCYVILVRVTLGSTMRLFVALVQPAFESQATLDEPRLCLSVVMRSSLIEVDVIVRGDAEVLENPCRGF